MFRRTSNVFIVLVLIAAGLITCIAASLRQKPPRGCVDSIEIITNTQLRYAECSPGKSIHYLRDLDGAAYIICRCSSVGDKQTGLPEIPGILAPPEDFSDEDDESLIDPKPEKENKDVITL